jgi:hypothetical protein
MEDCCIESFAQKGIRERFRLAAEDEGHVCETCGRVYRMLNGTWTLHTPVSTTAAVVDMRDNTFDMGWARGTRNRADHTIAVQCWGCGVTVIIPDQQYTEMHFDHANPKCNLHRALRNKRRNRMPVPKVH